MEIDKLLTVVFVSSTLVMSDIDPASRRSGESGDTPSVCQPVLRLQ